MLVKQFEAEIPSFNLIDLYERTDSFETDFLELEKLFWLSVKAISNDKKEKF